ncbi:MAG: homogentisate 1,2-dioxygenase [Alphaproteobacteria bacterium]|nr:homogentisate 1,2-dioxygenase [Alphaproteobacteria bacterium]
MYWSRGTVTRQAHVDIPDGTVEEEYGRYGFSGRVAHLYRSHPPVNWTRMEGPLKPRCFLLDRLPLDHAEPDQGGDWLQRRVVVLHNGDVRMLRGRLTAPMPYFFRNADADEILFVHDGAGRIETDFGPLDYRRSHYLVVPRGTVYRLLPTEPTELLVVESMGEVGLPERGLMGRHALFDPNVIDVPTPAAPTDPASAAESGEWEVRIQRAGQLSSVWYPYNPLDVVGWRGDLTVWRLHVDDIRPVLSERYHLPPSAHATFVGPGWVLCTFLPRGLETGDPGALRVPFYHSNIDYDEVIFYHDGDFFSREGIEPGMVTFHPQGIHHGPQPGAVAAAGSKTRTNEVAVMLDTIRPLVATDAAMSVQVDDYWKSWMTPASAASDSASSRSASADAAAAAR